MASTPIPLTTDGTGPEGAIPISLYGADSGTSTPVTGADIPLGPDPGQEDSLLIIISQMSNMLSDLTNRVAALENP